MKYLLRWTNARPEEAAEQRFTSRADAQKHVQSLLPQAEFLVLDAKAERVLQDVVYAWPNMDALESGKPHCAVIRPMALGNTLQIDAAFIQESKHKKAGR